MVEPSRTVPDQLAEASKKHERLKELFEAIQQETIRDRARYFEKLALLNGGALALSVSVLGYFVTRPAPRVHCVIALHTAWGLLLVGLLASVFRNLYHQNYRFYRSASWWAEAVAGLKSAEAEFVKSRVDILVDQSRHVLTSSEGEQFLVHISGKANAYSNRKDETGRKAAEYERLFRLCELSSHVAFVLGLVLMAFFVVANTP
jgi:hypothetical protein